MPTWNKPQFCGECIEARNPSFIIIDGRKVDIITCTQDNQPRPTTARACPLWVRAILTGDKPETD